MRKETRNVIVTICGFALLSSLAAYAATGAAFFTRFPSDEIGEANKSAGLGDLFGEETGLSEELGELEAMENRFTMGLLPSGPGRDSLSVMTVGGAAAAIALAAFFLERRSSCAASAPGGGGSAEDVDHSARASRRDATARDTDHVTNQGEHA